MNKFVLHMLETSPSNAGFSMRREPYTPHALDLSRAQNVKPRDDQSKGSNADFEFDSFAEELDSN